METPATARTGAGVSCAPHKRLWDPFTVASGGCNGGGGTSREKLFLDSTLTNYIGPHLWLPLAGQ